MALVRIVLLYVLGVLALFDASAYEITFPENDTPGYAPTTFLYPVNARKWALDIYGIRCAAFWADARAPFVFRSAMQNRPRNGGSVQPDGTTKLTFGLSGSIVGRFKNGRLVSYQRDGDDVAKARDVRLLGAMLPRRKIVRAFRRYSDHSRDGERYWQGGERLRLWYNNPNAAGTLFAELGLLALALILSVRRLIVRMLGGVLCAGALVGLWATGSRGSFVAFVLGAAVVGAVLAIYHGRKRLLLVVSGVLVAGLLAMALVFLGGRDRIHLDDSSSERLKIWRDAPRMMVAAPEGWSIPTGYAWCDWYEPLDDDFCTVWMVNSHISRLVKYGTASRFGYLFGWMVFLMFLCVYACRTGRTAALAQWTCFAVAMWFSTVGQVPSLWVAPAVPLAAMLVTAARNRNWLNERRRLLCTGLVIVAVAAILSCGGLWGLLQIGHLQESRQAFPNLVQRKAHGVQIGYGEPLVFLVHDNRVLTGGDHGVLGKEIRAYYQEHPDTPAMFIADSLADLPPKVDTLVLAGKAVDDYMSRLGSMSAHGVSPVAAMNLVLISPRIDWANISEEQAKTSNIRYVMGEFALQSIKSAKRNRPSWVECVPSAAIYPPDWLDRIFGKTETTTTQKEQKK